MIKPTLRLKEQHILLEIISASFSQPIAKPNSAPTPDDIVIANALQNVTRTIPGSNGAPPALAAIPPRMERDNNADRAIAGRSQCDGTMMATSSGNIAPAEKLNAEVHAA